MSELETSTTTTTTTTPIPLHLLSLGQILPARYIVDQKRHDTTVTSVLLFQLTLIVCILLGDYHTIVAFPHGLIDYLSRRLSLTERSARALIDNLVHFLVAQLAWLIIAYPIIENPFGEPFLVGLLASLIDLDHFVQAKSFRLVAACNLQRRAFLHDSFSMLVINVLIYVAVNSIWSSPYHACRCSLMFFTAWFTHHVRDAYRRGIWFGSLFCTPPIPYGVCFNILACSPIMIRALLVMNAPR